jgi:acyl carrier protein
MMQRPDLLQLARTEIAEILGVNLEEIQESTDLRDTYHVDSLELMEIGARLEMALGTELDAKQFGAIRTVKDAVDLLGGRLADAG